MFMDQAGPSPRPAQPALAWAWASCLTTWAELRFFFFGPAYIRVMLRFCGRELMPGLAWPDLKNNGKKRLFWDLNTTSHIGTQTQHTTN